MNKYNILFLALIIWVLSSCCGRVRPSETSKEKPAIFPDYVGVTIPATIAPLNFKAVGDYSSIDAVVKGKNGTSIHIQDKNEICIPERKWKKLLGQSKGDSLQITVSVKQHGNWKQYAPFSVYVSETPIDYGLAYRLIAPGYEVYSKMGIYQRNLSNFDQSAIIENTLLTGSCLNCHSFRQTQTNDMCFHIRGKKGGTILKTDGTMKLLNTKTEKTISNFVYPYWHPSGKYVAYSVNSTHQVFHAKKDERVEVIDGASDVLVYDVQNNKALLCCQTMQDSSFETFPSFSPDGRTLYFCAAHYQQTPTDYKKIKYDLCSISFDPDKGTFGNHIDTLFCASKNGKSVAFPRPSYDGRFIMFTLTDYGNFSIWHKEADLYLFDVKTGKTRRIDEVDSNDTESYHSWASNSRWFVFSSRRLDGLYTRPFIAYIDENGKATKPFLLPQKHTQYYDQLLFSFNVPEFISEKVDLNLPEVEHLMKTQGINVGL